MTEHPTGRLSIRVYYEDTDFSGRVYHAAYLRFFERGRTEWLRGYGFGHREVAGTSGVVFVVRRMEIEFLAPALMDDLIEVETDVSNIRGAVLEFQQKIVRDGQDLATAKATVAAIRNDRPTRIPELLRRALQRDG